MTPQISVVVPVYKVEQFVGECIESILAQTFTDFELLLVDDGSPDNSGKICDEYAARDSRIRVFHRPNGGVSSARNLGVERSRGEWICFVDSDDVLLPRALEVLFAETKNFPDADVIEGVHTRFREISELRKISDTGIPAAARSREPFVADGLTFAAKIEANDTTPFVTSHWRKIIRRELLLKTDALNFPPEIIFFEDALGQLRLATGIRRAVSIPKIVYGHRENPDSVCNSATTKTRYMTVDYCVKLWTAARDIFRGRDEKWQLTARLFIARTFPGAFLRATGTFLRHPQIQPFVSLVRSRELAAYPNSNLWLLKLILLGTRFPFTLVPEPIFRKAIRLPLPYFMAARVRICRLLKKL